MNNINSKKYEAICIGSGGTKGLLALGALHELITKEKLINDDIKYYSGCSVGSIIVVLLAIGYNPIDILVTICSSYFSNSFKHINFVNLKNIQGLYPNDILKNKIEELLIQKLGYSPTFKDIHENMGKYIMIPVYCLSEPVNKRNIYCSPENTPNMKIIDSLVMSCNIPLVFQKVVYEGKVYIDGAYTSSFPIKELEKITPKNINILGINLRSTSNNIDSLMGYILEIMLVPIQDQDNESNLGNNIDIINLYTNKISSFNFNMTTKDKIEIFNEGINQVRDFIN